MKSKTKICDVLAVICDDVVLCSNCSLLTPVELLLALVNVGEDWFWDNCILNGDITVWCASCAASREGSVTPYLSSFKKELHEFRRLTY